MASDFQIVISASRRTDIPAFYMPWFMERIETGVFEVRNPYTNHINRIPAKAGPVHTIVFWSKDFNTFLWERYGEKLRGKGYHLFFNFTINSEDKILEPNLPPLANRLQQLTRLCEQFGPDSIQWRFDPVCHYQDSAGAVFDNLHAFDLISEAAATLGVRRCVTSFMDPYRKVLRRAAIDASNIRFIEPSLGEKVAIVSRLQARLEKLSMQLLVCCEKEVLSALPEGKPVVAGACIPNDYLMALHGGRLRLQKDRGQRHSAGCGCMISTDIGSYELHPCHHRCLYCYANPSDGRIPARE
ncbi:MAG: DUF1848 family protein [Thermodesulfobacteriota bacterium]